MRPPLDDNSFLSTGLAKKGPVGRESFFFLISFFYELKRTGWGGGGGEIEPKKMKI